MVANADFEEYDGYGQTPQLQRQALLQCSEHFEVCGADTEDNVRGESYNDLSEREQESKQGFEMLE